MNKMVTVVDFQIFARAAGGIADDQRSINEALFATYEPLRLWLKERVLKAPFRKLLISFADEAYSAAWHGSVSVAAGICEVTEAVPASLLRQQAGDHRWVLGIVRHALECVAGETGWRSQELEGLVATMAEQPLPLMHVFERLTQEDKITGVKCEVRLAVQPGSTQLGVWLVSKGNVEREVALLSKRGPIFLEDEFPLSKSAIRRPDFLLLDKAGKILAKIPLEQSAMH
jgi:hypothetical protein